MNFNSYFNKALEYEKYLKLLGTNLALYKFHYKNFKLLENEYVKIKNLPSVNILIISEPWCGDSVALLPIVKRISEINPAWKLKLVLRNENVDLIDKLKLSIKYVPNYVLAEKIREEATKIAERKKTIEIAKAMKRRGIDDEIIAEDTGLPLEEVKKLRVRKKK